MSDSTYASECIRYVRLYSDIILLEPPTHTCSPCSGADHAALNHTAQICWNDKHFDAKACLCRPKRVRVFRKIRAGVVQSFKEDKDA